MEKQIDKRVSQLKQARRKRKWWQNLVVSLAIVVVFCTTYSLILNAITLEASEDPDLRLFTVNAVEYPGEYTWEDEAMGLSVTAALHGNASYVGTLSEDVMPELTVEMDEGEMEGWLERYSEAEDMPSIPLMSLRIRLHIGDTELLLDKCQADVTLRMKRELFAGDIMATGLNLLSSQLGEDLPEEPEPADPMEIVIELDCDLGTEPPVQEPIVAWTAADEQAEQDAVELSQLENETPDPEEPTDDPATQDEEAPAEEPADPVSAEPPEQEPVEPSAPEQTEPTQPEETEPTQPEETEPTQPEETEPAQLEETEPAQPEETEPAEDGSLLDEEEPVEVDQSIVLVATDGENELGYADMPEEGDVVLTFTIEADESVNIEAEYNPSFTIQHYLYFSGITTFNTVEELKAVNVSDGDMTSAKEMTTNHKMLPILNASLEFPYADVGNNKGSRTDNLDFKMGNRIENDAVDLLTGKKLFYVKVGIDDTLEHKEDLVRIFDDENTNYRLNPQIGYMSRLYRGVEDNSTDAEEFNANYTMTELWVYTPTGNNPPTEADIQNALNSTEKGNVDAFEFACYKVPESADGKRHDPSRIRFTNNPSNQHLALKDDETGEYILDEDGNYTFPEATEEYPYEKTVLIKDGCIIRLVFETTSSSTSSEDLAEFHVNFFDYDITDGKIYDEDGKALWERGNNEPAPVTETGKTKYVKTLINDEAQGINSSSNYSGNGAKLLFGNANTGLPDSLVKKLFGNDYINKKNDGVFQGCSFGLVSGMTYGADGYPNVTWSDGVVGSDLFSSNGETAEDNAVEGKRVRTDYKLGFARIGGTYTLEYVGHGKDEQGKDKRVVERLNKLINPGDYAHIFTNQFWPMDQETDELKFGKTKESWDYKLNTSKEISNSGKETYLPLSDDCENDHNSYFGMSFEVDFTIQPGYCAPLAYWFFGDDDLWVFLTKLDGDGNPAYKTDKNGNQVVDRVLIADIGGVHSSVGEYVNLWEYVAPIDLNASESQSYRMTVFYTERGASGSTCYMSFTLPLDTKISDSPPRDEELVIEKVVLNTDGTQKGYEEDGEQFTFLLTLRNATGANFEDVYHLRIYAPGDYADHTAENAKTIVDGSMGDTISASGDYILMLRNGEYAVISGLPDDTYYTIDELRYGQKIDDDGRIYYEGTDGNRGYLDDEDKNKIVYKDENGDVLRTEYVNQKVKWVTQYELGQHKHVEVVDENGNTKTKAVNTVLRAERYDYRIGDAEEAGTRKHYLSHSEDGYNYVRFINSKVGKTEVSPGDGEGVNVGEDIIYDVRWVLNDKSADVEVLDPLDEGVDFTSAKFVTAAEAETDSAAEAIGGEARKFALEWTLSGNDPIQIKEAEDGETISVTKGDHLNMVFTKDENIPEEEPGDDTEEPGDPVSTEDTVTTTYSCQSSDGVDWKLEKKTTAENKTTFSLLQWREQWGKLTDNTVSQEDGTGGDGEEGGTSDDVQKIGEIAYVLNYSPESTNADGTTSCKWSGHEVRWILSTDLPESVNCVSLKVKTNEKGLLEEKDEGKFGTKIARVENTAFVTITSSADPGLGDDSGDGSGLKGTPITYTTARVENPLPKIRKEEITPGNTLPVDGGDTITYAIYWENPLNEKAHVQVTDPLDTHKERDPDISSVTYDVGSAKAYYGEYDKDNPDPKPVVVGEDPVTGVYNERTHTLYWDLGEQEPGAEGYVIFTVKVKDDAKNDVIWNQGFVKVSTEKEEGEWLPTNEVYNPISGVALPAAGGLGIMPVLTVGLMLIGGSVWTLQRRKVRRKRR